MPAAVRSVADLDAAGDGYGGGNSHSGHCALVDQAVWSHSREHARSAAGARASGGGGFLAESPRPDRWTDIAAGSASNVMRSAVTMMATRRVDGHLATGLPAAT